MKRLSVAVVVALVGVSGACKPQEAPQAASPSPAAGGLATEQDKTAYAVGLMLGRNLVPLGLTPAELDVVKKGVADAASGKPPEVDLQTYGPKVEEWARARVSERAKGEKEKAKIFADNAAKEAGAVRTASGLVYRTLSPGKGASPAATDTVKVHYVGTLIDGTEFDSSVKRNEPAVFQLKGVIPCWTEGVQKMRVGEKARLVCPSELAYGDQGSPPKIPGGATLVFEVELLDVKK
jgi:FKBP-type peptidyl-prolyl cis-trans isomerase FkpA